MSPATRSQPSSRHGQHSGGANVASASCARGVRALPRPRLPRCSGGKLIGEGNRVVPRSHSPGPGSNNGPRLGPFGSRSKRLAAAALDVEPLPFFEPMIRCFLLGVSFGGLFESLTVLSQMADLSTHTANVWRTLADSSPQFVADHVLAVGLWLLFYAAECSGHDIAARGGNSSLPVKMALVPKILVPLDFKGVARAWQQSPYFKKRTGTRFLQEATLAAPAKQQTTTTSAQSVIQPETTRTQQQTTPTIDPPFVTDRPAREGLKPGQWNPVQNPNVQAEIARRGLLQNMYYCLGLVPQGGLKVNTVYEAAAMGTRMAYWSDDAGEVHMLSSTCTHRGAQLSKGWVDTVNGISCVRCPYHAWAYSGDGKVQDIPVQADGRFPKRALQQSYKIMVQGQLLWMFWGTNKICWDDQPPIPGLLNEDESMKLTHATSMCEVPHHTVFQVMASEAAVILFGRVFLDVPDAHLSEVGPVDDQDEFSRTQTYLMIPKAQGLCPLLPQGSPVPTMLVTLKAQLPSSVVMTFDLDLGRVVTLEAHVHPESYGISRLTLAAHRNFAKWPGASPMVRETLVMFSESLRGLAEKSPFSEHVIAMAKPCAGEPLLNSFYNLRANDKNVKHLLPAEIALVQQRNDM